MKENPFAREPSATERTAAYALRGMYLALVQQGFTEDQSIALLQTVIAGQIGGKP